MIDLAFAVLCSVSIGMIFKHTGRIGLDRTTLLTVNYAAAVGVAVLLFATGGRTLEGGIPLSAELLGLAGGVGVLLIAGFFLLSYATDVAGMSLAIGVMRVSVIIPFLASWLVWEEVPSIAQGVGMVLASAAFFLIAQKYRVPAPTVGEGNGASAVPGAPLDEIDWHASLVLALTFCAGGGVDLSMKAFEEGIGGESSRVVFLLLAFGAAFLVGLVMVVGRGVWRGRWPGTAAVGWGVVLGVVNYGSLEFLLRAIAELPGPFVFPANNIAIMLLAAALGVALWGERLSRINYLGLALAVVALILLRL
jgi:drug/metabolite transporter (DMT)-like permease